jgi:hypothetical protein
MRRDARIIVIAARLPRLLEQRTRCGCVTFDRHACSAKSHDWIVRIDAHQVNI